MNSLNWTHRWFTPVLSQHRHQQSIRLYQHSIQRQAVPPDESPRVLSHHGRRSWHNTDKYLKEFNFKQKTAVNWQNQRHPAFRQHVGENRTFCIPSLVHGRMEDRSRHSPPPPQTEDPQFVLLWDRMWECWKYKPTIISFLAGCPETLRVWTRGEGQTTHRRCNQRVDKSSYWHFQMETTNWWNTKLRSPQKQIHDKPDSSVYSPFLSLICSVRPWVMFHFTNELSQNLLWITFMMNVLKTLLCFLAKYFTVYM